MIKRFLATAFLLMFVTAAVGGGKLSLRPDGYGRAKIGMSLRELSRALNVKFAGPGPDDSDSCYYTNSPEYPGLGFMMEDKKLARIDLTEPGIATPEGIRVSDTEQQVKKAYGRRLQVESNAYIDEGHYFTVYAPGGKLGTRFETDGKKVTGFYAGTERSIEYIEGCL